MKSKGFIGIAVVFVVCAVVLVSLSGQAYAEGKKFKWACQDIFPAGSSLYKEFAAFAERVNVASNGRLEIVTHPVGAVVGYKEMIDAVKTNILQGYYSSPTFQSGKEPAFSAINNLPNCFENVMQAEAWMYQRGGIELLREAHAKFGTYPIGVVYYGREVLPSKVPLRSFDDFKGKKIRAPEGTVANMFRAMGASTVSMPGSEVYSALEKGVIEAADWGTRSMNDQMGLYEVCKYSIEPGFHSMAALEFVVTKKTWDSLPADLQQMLEAMVHDWSWRAVTRILSEDAAAGPKLRKMGVEVISLPPEDYKKIRELSRQTWLEWAKKSPLSKKAVDSKIAFAKELGLL